MLAHGGEMLFKASMPADSQHPDRNRRKLYGRRKGPKLSERQAVLRRTLLSELAYRPGGDPLAQFPNSVREVWLEVGFGAGEHLIWQAAQHPHVGLIGAEPYEMGVAKTRHHKRRFLQMDLLDQLARVLKPSAELRFATDDKSYLPYALERLMAHPAFDWMAEGLSDWKSRPADWPPTRYETKAIKGPPTFLRFGRR
jgi:tRNA (guanine-N7-)-methyltransferase